MEYPESRRALVEERLETVLDRVEPTELAEEFESVFFVPLNFSFTRRRP